MTIPDNGSVEPRKSSVMKREHKPTPITKYFAAPPGPSPSTYEASRPRQVFGNVFVDDLSYAASSGTTSTCSSPSYTFQDNITFSPMTLFSSPTSVLPPTPSTQTASKYEHRPISFATLDAPYNTSPEYGQSSTKFSLRDNLHRIVEELPHLTSDNLHADTPLKGKMTEITEYATPLPMVQSNSSNKTLRRVRSNLTEIESLKRRRGLVANMDIPNRIMTRRNSWHLGSSAVPSQPGAPRSERDEGLNRAWLGADERHITDEMCDLILRQSGVNLSELSSPLDAWSCVQQCLQELTEIVDTQVPQPNAETPQPSNYYPSMSHLPYQHAQPGTTGHSFNADSSDGSGNKRRSASGRDRGRDASNPPPNDGNQEEDRDQDEPPQRPSKDEPKYHGLKYGCPFRKRNKARFNIHDSSVCARTAFATFSTLKKHIQDYHGPGYRHKCPRCYEGFPTNEEMVAHLSLPRAEICDTIEKIDPENGISSEVDDALAVKDDSDTISTWDILWRALFSDDVDIPQPEFEPPKVLEVHEIESWFRSRKSALEKDIRDAVDEVLPGTDWQTNPLNTLITDVTTTTVNKYFSEWLELDAFDARGHIKAPPIGPPSRPIQDTTIPDQHHLPTRGARKEGRSGLVGKSYPFCTDTESHAGLNDRVPEPETESSNRFENSWTVHHQTGYDIPINRSSHGPGSYTATGLNNYHSNDLLAPNQGLPTVSARYSASEQSGSMKIDSLDLSYDGTQQAGNNQPSIVLYENDLEHEEYHARGHPALLPPSRDSGIEAPRPKTASGRLFTNCELGSRGYSA